MQDLRLVLIILGLIAIVALIVHGLWSSKKNAIKPIKDQPLDKIRSDRANPVKDTEGFDIDGIGPKRVVRQNPLRKQSAADLNRDAEPVNKEKIEPQIIITEAGADLELTERDIQMATGDVSDTPYETESFTATTVETPTVQPSPVQPQSVASQSEQSESIQVPTETSQAVDVQTVVEEPVEVEPEAYSADEAPAVEEAVFVINIMARDNKTINGSCLLQELSTLGFKFGEMNIFHRHVDPAGKGPVLFSLANMVKPGTFDIDSMEQFSTQGLSLFMTFPCAGEALKNYNLMLSAAEKIANGVDAMLFDMTRNPLTPQVIQHDREQIIRLERQSLLSKKY